MKFSLLVVFTMLLTPMLLFSQSTSELQMMYIGVLEQQGYTGTLDSDGDIRFQVDNKTYFFGVDENDTEFYRLVLANIWPIESELERLKAFKAVNEINKTKKVVKAYVINDNIWISVELFLKGPEDFSKHFSRQLSIIQSSAELLVEEM